MIVLVLMKRSMPKKYRDKFRVDSAGLKGYDYSRNGSYFVTICTNNRKEFLGEIVETHDNASPQKNASLRPSVIGQIAIDYWNDIPLHFPFVKLDAFQIMPNHVHGIIIISNQPVETHDNASLPSVDEGIVVETHNNASLPSVDEGIVVETHDNASLPPVNGDIAVETHDNASLPYRNKFGPQSRNLSSIIRGYKGAVKTYATKNNIEFAWQPRFFDRIIRDEKEFQSIRNYIKDNPKNWSKDKNNEEGLYF